MPLPARRDIQRQKAGGMPPLSPNVPEHARVLNIRESGNDPRGDQPELVDAGDRFRPVTHRTVELLPACGPGLR